MSRLISEGIFASPLQPARAGSVEKVSFLSLGIPAALAAGAAGLYHDYKGAPAARERAGATGAMEAKARSFLGQNPELDEVLQPQVDDLAARRGRFEAHAEPWETAETAGKRTLRDLLEAGSSLGDAADRVQREVGGAAGRAWGEGRNMVRAVTGADSDVDPDSLAGSGATGINALLRAIRMRGGSMLDSMNPFE